MTKVKICGLRTVEDARKVNALLPEYVGLVFAPSSRRRVTLATAREIKAALAPEIQVVGVFVNQTVSEIATLADAGVIDLVQLHGEETSREGIELPVIKSVAIGGEVSDELPQFADYLLLDTATPGAGKTFNWRLAKRIKTPYFLAGGLNETNITQAIEMLHPYCVDVSSGVETDGAKDIKKIRRFIRLVRKDA